MRPRKHSRKNTSITSAAFLSAWVQSVQRAECISRESSAGSIHSHCALLIYSIAQMEPYLPVKSRDERLMELNLQRFKDAQSVSNAIKKKMEVCLNYFHGKSSVSFIFRVLLSNTLTYFAFIKTQVFP